MLRNVGPGTLGLALAISMAACNRTPSPPAAAQQPAAPAPTSAATEEAAQQPTPPAATPPVEVKGLGAVFATRLNVRSSPSTSGQVTAKLLCGDVVDIEGREGDWYKIRLQERKADGYSNGAFINRLLPGVGKRAECEGSRRGPAASTPVTRAGVDMRPVLKETNRPGKDAPDSGPPVSANASPQVDATSTKLESAPSKPEPTPPKLGPTQPVGAGTPKDAGSGPQTIKLSEGKGPGSVGFSHWAHQNAYKSVGEAIACNKCHHPAGLGEDGKLERKSSGGANSTKKCHGCHDSGGSIVGVTSKSAFHKTCIDCHRGSGSSKAPTGCEGCHRS